MEGGTARSFGDQALLFITRYKQLEKAEDIRTLVCKWIYINRNLFSFVLLEVTRHFEVANPSREFIADFIVQANAWPRTGMRMRNAFKLKKVALDWRRFLTCMKARKRDSFSTGWSTLSFKLPILMSKFFYLSLYIYNSTLCIKGGKKTIFD